MNRNGNIGLDTRLQTDYGTTSFHIDRKCLMSSSHERNLSREIEFRLFQEEQREQRENTDRGWLQNDVEKRLRQILGLKLHHVSPSRVTRVKKALELSFPLAWGTLKSRFAELELTMIWPILKALLEDIAYYYGGSVVLGAGVGFLAGRGAGVVPGAVVGHYAGIAILNLMGFKAIAETILPRLPEIARGYAEGFLMAWGPSTEQMMSRVVPININVTGAAHKMATAHVAFVIVLLLSLWLWLTRAKGSQRLEVLAQISNNKRLGPTMARWLEKHEKQLENVYRSEMGSHSGGTRSAPETVTTTPSQARAAEAKTAKTETQKPVEGKVSATFSEKQLDKKFKHADDFGLSTTKKNPETLAQYKQALEAHLEDANTYAHGTYLYSPNSTVFYNPTTNNVVIVGQDGAFISGWKLDPGSSQFNNFINNGVLK
jgi:hypothetical protein